MVGAGVIVVVSPTWVTVIGALLLLVVDVLLDIELGMRIQ